MFSVPPFHSDRSGYPLAFLWSSTCFTWCKDNGCWDKVYSRYIENCCPTLKKRIELFDSFGKFPDSESTSKLYHERRDEILSVFLEYQSKSEIEEHKREIILCVKCLKLHIISGNEIYLPNSDLNDLIDTFIDHLSRCEEVLEGDVDEEYCSICVSYTFKVQDKWDSFLPKISPTFQRILERGSKKKLRGEVALRLLITLKNISNSPTSSTRSSILTLIKPYFRYWLRKYDDSECYGNLMYILSKITLSSDDSTPNKSLCSETWDLFFPVLDVLKSETNEIVEGAKGHHHVLSFFSNLCCDHAKEVYHNITDEYLDEWFTIIKEERHKWGIIYWSKLISMFSTVPSLVPLISPKYDVKMMKSRFFDRYFSNISSHIASSYLPKLLHSIPPVSLIPSIETSLCLEKDGYSYASHVCCQMSVETDVDFSNCDIFDDYFSTNFIQTSVVNIITKKEMTKDQQIIQRGRLCFGTKDEHPDDDDVGKRRFSSLGIEEPSHSLSAMMGTMKKGSINSHIPDKMLDEPSSQKKQSTLMGEKQEEEEEEEFYNFF
ncbi:hypothetical protein ADUPG1_009930 [Aduncisulcus paluster]|uniref:Uncharacterized protein n=1 Tax=Aduncisulcus paluster TaxID=2918883 RepID=A0ABQ5L018_9EUKA|nr:hypothetical protein ADUPG1_009930 [Aduncisulcus paluster]